MRLYLLTPIFRATSTTKDNIWELLPTGTSNCVMYSSQQTDLCHHCVIIDLDNQLLRKVPGYDGQNKMAACPTWEGVLCTSTCHPVFVDGKRFIKIGKDTGSLMGLKQWASHGSSSSPGVRPYERQGRPWETSWHTQTKLNYI